MTGGYTYDTQITVAGNVASQVTGRWVGGASEFILEAAGQSVTYRAIPPQAWVLKPGSAWVEVTGGLPSGDPVAMLAKPAGLQVISNAADALVVDATYPPSALGLTGTAVVTVRLTLAADGSVTASYTTQMSTGPAISTTVLKPASGLAPVVAPTQSAAATAG